MSPLESVPPFPENVPSFSLPRLMLSKVPSNDAAQSLEMFKIFQEHGFALLDLRDCEEGQALLEQAAEMFGVAEAVTKGLPLEEKLKYEVAPPKKFHGYSRVGKTKTEEGLPDRFECFGVDIDEIQGNKPREPQPAPVEASRDTIKSYIKNATAIGMLIMDQLDVHLRLPKGTLASLQRIDQRSLSQMRLIRYPPQPEGDRRTAFLGHTDLGTLTMLISNIGGLQILPPGEGKTEENWKYIKPEPGCMILNIGDAMVEWTGGILRSNLHRVSYAPGAQAVCERYSLALAIRPEAECSMARLDVPGSLIPALEDGEVNMTCTASEWGVTKAKGLTTGKDTARSRGGRLLKAY